MKTFPLVSSVSYNTSIDTVSLSDCIHVFILEVSNEFQQCAVMNIAAGNFCDLVALNALNPSYSSLNDCTSKKIK